MKARGMFEKVKRFLGCHVDEFKRGDILVEIGYTLKYIVVDEFKTVYYLKPMREISDSRTKEFNWFGRHEGPHEKFRIEGSGVKVGVWDFETEKEVDDVELD